MQETFFNELCLRTGELDYSCWRTIIQLQKELRIQGFTVCRISSEYRGQLKKSLDELETKTPSAKTMRNIFYSFFHTEYDPAAVEKDETLAEDFLSHDVTYDKEKVIGLAWANYFDTFALSFSTSEQWDKATIEIEKDGVTDIVHHASRKEHIEQNSEWIESRKSVELLETLILPENKKLHLRDDHGNDVLAKFWKRLKNCEYVESCLDSLEWMSWKRDFIRDVFSDGIIHITIPWDDRGLGMKIKTTGRNRRETEAIAKILEERYAAR